MKFKIVIALLALAIQAPAYSQEEASPTAGDTAQEQLTVKSGSVATEKSVPKISVRWDCGTCEQNPKVGPLIEQTYATGATEKGYVISNDESAEIVIKEYRQRSPASRVLFGAMAGKDKLSTKLNFRGKEYTAEDYSANAIQGMNSLCESVAQQALTQVLAAIKQ